MSVAHTPSLLMSRLEIKLGQGLHMIHISIFLKEELISLKKETLRQTLRMNVSYNREV